VIIAIFEYRLLFVGMVAIFKTELRTAREMVGASDAVIRANRGFYLVFCLIVWGIFILLGLGNYLWGPKVIINEIMMVNLSMTALTTAVQILRLLVLLFCFKNYLREQWPNQEEEPAAL
jgi:hypothetical protein